MQEDFSLSGGGGNVIRSKGFSFKAVYPKAAVYPRCGEVSIYIAEDKLEKLVK